MIPAPQMFQKLIADFQREWASEDGNLEKFPSVATRELENFKYDLTQSQFDSAMAEWLVENSRLPDQINVHNTFGEPPITIFNNGVFVVEVYIWIGCDTSIHSHGFRGAFRVLQGLSLHEKYAVKVTETIAHDVELTELGTPTTEILKRGDVRTIEPGKDLTHRILHLQNPTITLCIKTIGEKALSQWHHFLSGPSNGLAIQKRHLDPALIKQVYFFQYLAARNGQQAGVFLDRLIARQDISTLMNLCEELASGGYEIADEFVELILAKIYDRFGSTEWFRRYEESAQVHAEEVSFERLESPEARLTAYFRNLQLGENALPMKDQQRLLSSLEN